MVGARGIKRKRILRGPPHWATALLKIVYRVDKVCFYTSRALQKSRIAPASLLKVGARGIERKRILRRPPHRATAILKSGHRLCKACDHTSRALQKRWFVSVTLLMVGARRTRAQAHSTRASALGHSTPENCAPTLAKRVSVFFEHCRTVALPPRPCSRWQLRVSSASAFNAGPRTGPHKSWKLCAALAKRVSIPLEHCRRIALPPCPCSWWELGVFER